MRKCIAAVCLCFTITAAFAQNSESTKADALWQQGKKLEALPLYDDLFKNNPKNWGYAERLAGALGAAAEHADDPAQAKALLTRQRDTAKQAVALGDTEYYVLLMSQIDPDKPVFEAPTNKATALFNEAEKAYSAGDYPTALTKYAAAADADPKMYEAALYAGDSAFVEKDVPTAAKWFARAIAIDPARETAYRYWGDALLRVSNDPIASKPKYIDAVVAEPYNKLSLNGITFWANTEKAALGAPRIDLPAGPVIDPAHPDKVSVTLAPDLIDEKKHPGSGAWIIYPVARAKYRTDEFKKDFPNEPAYRHTLKEEDEALTLVVKVIKEKGTKPEDLDVNLRNLVTISDAGMLDCWILLNGADNGIAKDYNAYRDQHWQLLHDYIDRFILHGGQNASHAN